MMKHRIKPMPKWRETWALILLCISDGIAFRMLEVGSDYRTEDEVRALADFQTAATTANENWGKLPRLYDVKKSQNVDA